MVHLVSLNLYSTTNLPDHYDWGIIFCWCQYQLGSFMKIQIQNSKTEKASHATEHRNTLFFNPQRVVC